MPLLMDGDIDEPVAPLDVLSLKLPKLAWPRVPISMQLSLESINSHTNCSMVQILLKNVPSTKQQEL